VLATRARASAAGVVPLELEGELVLGEILSRGSNGSARVLAELQRDAQARGFLRISGEARRLLAESSSARFAIRQPVLTRR
jgi:hypothetical protein